MPWASNSVRTSSNFPTAANSPFAEILTSATDYPLINRITISDVATNDPATCVLGLIRSTTVGVPAPNSSRPLASPFAFADESGLGHSSGVYIATTWSTLPIFGTGYLRRVSMGNLGTGFGLGCFLEWSFAGGLKLSPNTSLVIVNLLAISSLSTPMLDISVEVDS